MTSGYIIYGDNIFSESWVGCLFILIELLSILILGVVNLITLGFFWVPLFSLQFEVTKRIHNHLQKINILYELQN